jgi:hypothetical protein
MQTEAARATAKDIKNPMIRKIVIAERRHVNGNDERELKEVTKPSEVQPDTEQPEPVPVEEAK